MRSLILLCFVLVAGLTHAQQAMPPDREAPQQDWWELGAGLAAVSFPHYPGAEQSAAFIAPIPYPQYHGKRVNLDEEGLIADLVAGEDVSLKASLNGSLPVSDEDNERREGMADLDLLVEAGPALHISLWQREATEWRIELPLRAAFAMDSLELPRHAGWTSNPGLYYDTRLGDWDFEASVGGIWSDGPYHDFFYRVGPQDATATRPAYEAEAGFTAWRGSTTLKRRWGDVVLLGYLRYMNFSDATNADSPLLVENDYYAGGLSLVYMFYSSK